MYIRTSKSLVYRQWCNTLSVTGHWAVCCAAVQRNNLWMSTSQYSGRDFLGLQHWPRGPGPKIQVTTSMAGSRITLDPSSASYALLLPNVHCQQHAINQVRSSCLSLPWQKGPAKFKGLHKATSWNSERSSLVFQWFQIKYCITWMFNVLMWKIYYKTPHTAPFGDPVTNSTLPILGNVPDW